MDQSLLFKIFTKIGIGIFVIAIVDLVFINWWILQKQELDAKPDNRNIELVSSPVILPSPTPVSSSSVAPQPTTSPVPSNSSSGTKEVQNPLKETLVIQNAQKEIFIPLGSGQTKSHTFADLYGVEVTIDASKYTAIDSVIFETSLYPEGGNGRAGARILNVNDNNPFVESEVYATGPVSILKSSQKIPIPAGIKTYRVQAKSDVENFAAIVDNARIKITLK